jgi:CubicO group peptidase (beta-lactamase class C family)
MYRWFVVAIVACGGSSGHPATSLPPVVDTDPVGAHQAQVAAQARPYIEGELASGIVVGLIDGGKTEIYGFGVGPGGKPPRGDTLFEIGPVTKLYTALLLADAIQRRELSSDTPVADLLPPGVSVPTFAKQPITLRHLALHASGLPPVPPSIAAHPNKQDPYGGYGEDALYADLGHTQLAEAPGTRITSSSYGLGLLGFALGRKIGGGYAQALRQRVLGPLGLADTYLAVPPAAAARRASGTDPDLAKAPPWSFDALAGAGALISTVRDQLAVVRAELDAAAGSRVPLRLAMHFTQEDQLEDAQGQPGGLGLGWEIDRSGRYWVEGSTGGFHAFVGFDPKTQHGVVVLASTATSIIDRLAGAMYAVLDGQSVPPLQAPTDAEQATFVGHYELGPTARLGVVRDGKRLYLEGDVGRVRMAPMSDHEFWIEALQSYAVFEKDGEKIARMVFVGERRIAASRVD